MLNGGENVRTANPPMTTAQTKKNIAMLLRLGLLISKTLITADTKTPIVTQSDMRPGCKKK